MVTDAAAMAVVRAAHPALRGAHDGVAFAVHATFLAAGYSLCAVGPAALTDPSPSGDEEVGIDGWNSMENCYAFLYSKEEKGKKKRVLLKCLVIGEVLSIDVLDLEAQDKGPYINVKDFFVEEQPKNYGEMYKNFASLIETVNSNVLCKFDGNVASPEAAKSAAAAVAAKNSDAERSSSIQSSEDPGPRTADPSGSYHLHIPRIGTARARGGGGKGRSRSIQGGGAKMAKLSEKTSLLKEAEKRIELTSMVEEQQKLKGYSSPDREGGGRGQQSVRQSTRRRQANWSPLPLLSSPVSTTRVSWSEAHTLLLYGYCVEEIESSSLEELSEDSYEIITQKLCDKGANHNIKSVKEKVRGTKKLYTFWKDKVMNPCVVKDEKWWAKQGRQYQKLRDGPPKHLNLIQRIFEPCEKSSGRGLHESAQSQLFELRTQSDENQAAEAEICLLMNEVKMVCLLMDEFERARAQSVSVQREKEEVDDIDIERVEQLTSAYNLALAAAKENPTDDKFMRAAVKARLALTAAVLRPD